MAFLTICKLTQAGFVAQVCGSGTSVVVVVVVGVDVVVTNVVVDDLWLRRDRNDGGEEGKAAIRRAAIPAA